MHTPQPPEPPRRFVPSGVDAQSWLGFEQRIQERRFRALLETIDTAITARDGSAARAALDEARELRPHAPELQALESRLAHLPAPGRPASGAGRLTVRAMGAAAMLAVGVGLVMGIEWLHPIAPLPSSSPVIVTTPPATEPAAVGTSGVVAPVESVNPTDSAGTPDRALPEAAPEPEPTGEEPVGPATLRRASVDVTPGARPNRPTFRTALATSPLLAAGGEVPDDYVAPRARREGDSRPAAVAAGAGPSRPASAPGPSGAEETRVAQVLNQYARTYGAFDARAAASFDTCDITVNGTSATAACRGTTSYAGGGEPQVEGRQWNFELTRVAGTWSIVNTRARGLGYDR